MTFGNPKNQFITLKEHCTQKKIWIHLMPNIFRNQTVKNLTILDHPFKRYDFSKFSLNSVKSLCRPHKLATVPCHGCTIPHWFCTQIITNFQFSWIWVKLLIKLIPKSIQIHIYPKQTWLISRGNLLFTWELFFFFFCVHYQWGVVHPWHGTVANLWGRHKDFTEFNENFEKSYLLNGLSIFVQMLNVHC